VKGDIITVKKTLILKRAAWKEGLHSKIGWEHFMSIDLATTSNDREDVHA